MIPQPAGRGVEKKRPALLVGITATGIIHDDPFVDVEGKFEMVKAEKVFDYIDRTPPPAELDAYRHASEKHGIPLLAGGFFYTLGRDEPLLDWNLRVAAQLGTRVHNVQIRTHDAQGTFVSNERVAETYLWAAELGDKYGICPSFEVHINMWSEHFGRVEQVATLVEQRGIPFHMTLDHSHVIFKMDNPREQEVQGMRPDVESGRLILDPYMPGSVTERWIKANWVRHAHARPAVPANPINIWARHPDGSFGRGVQYPFIEPQAGEWHSPWAAHRLEPWKEVVRQLLRHHFEDPGSKLETLSLEMIANTDYGAGAKYSLFRNNVACASWIRSEWEALCGAHASKANSS